MPPLHKALIYILFLLCSLTTTAGAQTHSVARMWNEQLLEAIRNDFARPTVHARNLFHTSVAMYDAWAAYDETASTYFLNHSFRSFYCHFEGVSKPADVQAAREEAISYAMYRLLKHRFKDSPRAAATMHNIETLFARLGYDPAFTSTNYKSGSPAAFGNYLAEKLIAWGLRDGANEINGYLNDHYQPSNPPLDPKRGANLSIRNPNLWQPLALESFVDQSGTVIGKFPPIDIGEISIITPSSGSRCEAQIDTREKFHR